MSVFKYITGSKVMFNAVIHFNFIFYFQVDSMFKYFGLFKVILLCVIVTETEKMRVPPLTKLYSGIQ